VCRRHAIILAAVMSAYAAAAGAVPPPVIQYGAECKSPTFATDVLVCSDTDLRQLDADVRALLEKLRQDSPEAAPQLEVSQWDWFKRRSECALRADHRQCVVDA